MNLKNKKVALLALTGAMIIPSTIPFNVFADSFSMVTIGESLNEKQKNQILNYFGVKENEVDIKIITNKDERKYLEGIVPDEQIGHKTYSCAYIQPTEKGSGINVKTANLNYVTPQMIKSAVITLGLENTDMNIVGASVIPVSGTGFLTGVLTSLEALGIQVDEDKKEIANEELIITGDLGEDIGKDKATGVINDIKTEIIKNNTQDTIQIAETINNVTNNYNVTLNASQEKSIQELMEKISKQDYDYNALKSSLKDIKKSINETLQELGEKVDNFNLFEKIGMWFEGIGEWISSLFEKETDNIINATNDKALGDNVISTSTEDTIPAEEIANGHVEEKEEGFFQKLWNWFIGLFSNDKTTEDNTNSELTEEIIDEPVEEQIETPQEFEENQIDEQLNPELEVEENITETSDEITNDDMNTELEAPEEHNLIDDAGIDPSTQIDGEATVESTN